MVRISLGERAVASCHWLGMSATGNMPALRQPDGIVAFETPSRLRIMTVSEGAPRASRGSARVTDHEGIAFTESSLSESAAPLRFRTHVLSF